MVSPNKPVSHLQEAEKLTADALVDLYEFKLRTENVTVRIKSDASATWQGNLYEGFPIEMTGEKRSADDQESRPRMRVFNPEGIFNSAARDGLLDRATVTRRRVLLRHLDGNVAISQNRMWYVSRVSEVIAGQTVQFELRSMTEGPNFQIPARQYTPDQGFPFVRLR